MAAAGQTYAAGPGPAAPELPASRTSRASDRSRTLRRMPTLSSKKFALKSSPLLFVSSSTADKRMLDGLPPAQNDRLRRAYTSPVSTEGRIEGPASSSTANVSYGLPRAKLNALERFKRLGKTTRGSELPVASTREQGKGKERVDRNFPPAEWNIDEHSRRSSVQNGDGHTRRTREHGVTNLRLHAKTTPLPELPPTAPPISKAASSEVPPRASDSPSSILPEEEQPSEPTASATAFTATDDKQPDAKTSEPSPEGAEKPEAFSSYLARRMQGLMSGLSFSSTSSTPSHSTESAPLPTQTQTTSPSETDKSSALLQKSMPTQEALSTEGPIVTRGQGSIAAQGPVETPKTVSTPIEQQKQAVQSTARLAALLASTREMNNSIAKGAESAWAALDRFMPSKGKEKGKGKERENESIDANMTAGNSVTDTPTVNEEMEGSRDIMLYSPLIPDLDSLVEVAASEVVTLYDDEREKVYRSELRRRWAEGHGIVPMDSMPMDSMPMFEHVEDQNSEQKGEEKREEADKPEPKPKSKERVVWMPSTTEISVQVLWWGYRIYLPPPVLQVLNSKSLEAAKRATLITTSLKWLLDHLPTTLLPVQLQPAASLLTCLVPLLGAIGTFIAWSWRAIGTFDKGYGVVLSATWLLPVVLIPGTWEADEIPHMDLSQGPSTLSSTDGA